MGPLILGVSLEGMGVMHLAWPPGVPEAAFLVLGVYVGLLFDWSSIKRAGPLFPSCSRPPLGSWARVRAWVGHLSRSQASMGLLPTSLLPREG
jgi:hypothetical protein